MGKVRWGVLSTSRFARNKVIPAIRECHYAEVTAIASRNLGTAREAARDLGIGKAYGSYGELLTDPEVDAIYNPMPNHLHVEWSIKALEAGKHVLCEKPIGVSSVEAQLLLNASRKCPSQKVMEAFMYRFHPQWRRAKQLVDDGAIGELRTIHSMFSYHNIEPDNIRNRRECGGGAMMDIGCYNVSLSRFIFDSQPKRVFGLVEYDPAFGTDRLASGILEFARGAATFTCSTQLVWRQSASIIGTTGRIEFEIPFNAPHDKPCRIWLQQHSAVEEIAFEICNQYAMEVDALSLAILNDSPVPTPLEDAVDNMKTIEAVFESSRTGAWVHC